MHTATTSTLIAASVALLLTSAVEAMEIQQFDKLASEDKGEYVGLLVGGAEQAFKDEGRADLAAKIEDLFTRPPSLPGSRTIPRSGPGAIEPVILERAREPAPTSANRHSALPCETEDG